MPKYIVNRTLEKISTQWPKITHVGVSVVKKEALLWQQMCFELEERPFTFMDSLNFRIFPKYLKCATLPVTVTTVIDIDR